ncbi:MAG: aminoacetone oxidase family FAD-binding enzyme, partial [Oscillospiraceae bacterium]|nr:aminoacetone oxidase family FAD-binding enzyme [Oscillospiraceae bacterium]
TLPFQMSVTPAAAVIVATGGVSYPATGSTGDGYRFAESVGHTIVTPRGSLVPLESNDEDCLAMQGFSLKNVTLTVRNKKNKVIFSELGEMLFTHFGISGPLVLSASSHMRDFAREEYSVTIDLKPALDEQKLDARLLRDFEERANQNFANLLGGLVNRSMIPVIIKRTGIDGETKVHSITREQRKALIRTLKNFSVEVTGPRPVRDAIITSGGVKVGEIDPKTMASKKIAGLYFAGEVIDVDAYTGGYNLQIAWATGKAAGEAASAELQYL